MDQTGINSADFPPPLCPLEILSPTPNTSIEIETQQPPTPAQIDNWHTLGFIYAVEEGIMTDTPADISLESPTIPFDEDSPPDQPPSELLPSSQEAGHAASSPAPVVEINADEEDDPTRCPNHAISEPLLRKRKREDVDGVDFRSKLKHLVKEVLEPYEALEKEKRQWEKDKEILQAQIQFLQRQLGERKPRNILKCALCHRTFNEEWKFLGCGHTLCQNCVDDIKSKHSLFEYPCPYTTCQKPILSCLDFYPNVVDA
ncbi:hypothetical protein PMAA_007980 [Talaromyces marneffei ATCC 18224]|uniref:RING-type domain-containing protein n=2 Tax=Talaromyces marneffei TaxID=37727 RepID=B6QWE7_TALMQ|nr:hypothetical protein PMAA_007980 [Talaromyces marneffei ATCC 18224]